MALESTGLLHIMQQYHLSITQVGIFLLLTWFQSNQVVVKTLPISVLIDALIFIEPSDHLNHWMLAMIGIGCVFIAFVGVSIYLMW